MLILRAVQMAVAFHGDQLRKNSGMPYIIHPIRVANYVSTFTDDENMIIAAILHDVLEDTEAKFKDIERMFDPDVANLVDELTKKNIEGPRIERCALEKVRLSKVSDRAKLIKLADIMDNCSDYIKEDPVYAVSYCKEKLDLLPVLSVSGYQHIYYDVYSLLSNFVDYKP